MTNEAEKLENLERRRKQLGARIQSIRARTVKQERARETRRKILAGAYFIKLVGGDLKRVGLRLKDAGFLQPRDFEIFGLEADD